MAPADAKNGTTRTWCMALRLACWAPCTCTRRTSRPPPTHLLNKVRPCVLVVRRRPMRPGGMYASALGYANALVKVTVLLTPRRSKRADSVDLRVWCGAEGPQGRPGQAEGCISVCCLRAFPGGSAHDAPWADKRGDCLSQHMRSLARTHPPAPLPPPPRRLILTGCVCDPVWAYEMGWVRTRAGAGVQRRKGVADD